MHNSQAQRVIDAVQEEGGWVLSQLMGHGEHIAPSTGNGKAAPALQTHHL